MRSLSETGTKQELASKPEGQIFQQTEEIPFLYLNIDVKRQTMNGIAIDNRFIYRVLCVA